MIRVKLRDAPDPAQESINGNMQYCMMTFSYVYTAKFAVAGATVLTFFALSLIFIRADQPPVIRPALKFSAVVPARRATVPKWKMAPSLLDLSLW